MAKGQTKATDSKNKNGNGANVGFEAQLFLAAEWFAVNYEGYRCVRVSVHPKNRATKAAVAGASHALTYEKLAAMISDARILLTALCESQLSDTDLVTECSRLLISSPINANRLVDSYLVPFED